MTRPAGANPTRRTVAEILRDIADIDPIVTDPENPAQCFYCGSERTSGHPVRGNFRHLHGDGCLWVEMSQTI